MFHVKHTGVENSLDSTRYKKLTVSSKSEHNSMLAVGAANAFQPCNLISIPRCFYSLKVSNMKVTL